MVDHHPPLKTTQPLNKQGLLYDVKGFVLTRPPTIDLLNQT